MVVTGWFRRNRRRRTDVIVHVGADTVTGQSLARIERQLDLIMQHLEIEPPESSIPGVVAELEQGRKIQAIKIYRQQTGAGLAEAKAAAETIARDRGL